MGREKERERARACTRERESVRKHFGSSFYVFSSTWACPMQIGLSQECCLFCLSCLKSSLWSSELPCVLATAILDSFSLFYLPNKLILNMRRGSGRVCGLWGAARVAPSHRGHPPWSREGRSCLQGAASGSPLGTPVTCAQCSAPVLCGAGLPRAPEQGRVPEQHSQVPARLPGVPAAGDV